MMKNGKPINSIYFGGEHFVKYTKDDEDALAKYKKMKALIGTQVYVRTSDDITDLNVRYGPHINSISPKEDGYVNVTSIEWDGGNSVDLIGWLDVNYDITNMGGEGKWPYNDLCIVGSADI